VPPEEITKGYPYQPDQYVQLSADEIDQLQADDDKTIHLKHFVEPAHVDLVLFAGRSLYLVPANPAAQSPFATVQQAIHDSGKWGIGLVVFSGKRQTLIVRPEDHILMAHTLYHPALRRALANGDIGDPQVPAKELRPLSRVISSANGVVPWDDFQVDTDRRLAELVQAKLRPTTSRRRNGANGRTRSTAARSRSKSGATRARNRRRAA
jgi:DNA end-binding protein Ku